MVQVGVCLTIMTTLFLDDWVIWPFTRYRDLTTQSSRFWDILVILDFFFGVILVVLEL